jgi:uncharacterized protein (TIGR00375 family)
MTFENISSQGVLKGLSVVGTGDALHPKWIQGIKKMEKVAEGIYENKGCKFVVTVEVEDYRKVHHLIFLPGLSSAQALREELKKFSLDIDADGRPHVRIGGEELAEHVEDVGGFLGPSHAFVPWTSIYKEYDSIKYCYGKNTKKIKILELGLSADSEMADLIKELENLVFLSNSDAHSPWPHRLGREFNRLKVKDITFKEIKKAIFDKGIELNVGLDPRLGKYHRTACINCFALYELEDAIKLKWRCKCGGLLKKGVYDRVKELSSYDIPRHPPHRPSYIRITPLAEILCLAFNVKSVYSSKVQTGWNKLVERFGSEISVLLDAPVEEIKKESGDKVGDLIWAYRNGKFSVIEGGGGRYGKIVFDQGSQSMLDFFIR